MRRVQAKPAGLQLAAEAPGQLVLEPGLRQETDRVLRVILEEGDDSLRRRPVDPDLVDHLLDELFHAVVYTRSSSGSTTSTARFARGGRTAVDPNGRT